MSLCAAMLLLSQWLSGAAVGQERAPIEPVDLEAPAPVHAGLLKHHLQFLASDKCEGREPGTPGFEEAGRYVESRLKNYGVLPKGDQNEGYRQRILLEKESLAADRCWLEISSGKETKRLKYLDDVVFWDADARKRMEVGPANCVFVGHGITMNEKQDDYAGIDAKGKIAVCLIGYPEHTPEEFQGWWHKIENAKKHGAHAVLVILTPKEAELFPWSKHSERWDQGFVELATDDDSEEGSKKDAVETGARAIPLIFVGPHSAQALFEGNKFTAEEIFQRYADEDPLPAHDLKTKVKFSFGLEESLFTSYNLVGMIEGSHPELKQEYVIYCAHLDHVGKGREIDGDAIFNGALDNASGVAVMLEIARIYSKLPKKKRPARSIILLFSTAEESGGQGVEYFLENSQIDKKSMIACLNIDTVLSFFPMKDVIAIGEEQSTLSVPLELAARTMGVKLTPDQQPEQKLFERGDQYDFVLAGIPAVMLEYGIENEKGDGLKQVKAWFAGPYHARNDDSSQAINYEGMARFTEYCFRLGLLIGSAPERPEWNPESRYAPKKEKNDGDGEGDSDTEKMNEVEKKE